MSGHIPQTDQFNTPLDLASNLIKIKFDSIPKYFDLIPELTLVINTTVTIDDVS